MIKRLLNSNLARGSGIYVASNLLNSLIPFLLLPVLTRFLTPADYGIVTMFQITLGIVFPFIGLSIHGAINRKYFDQENTDLPKYIGNCFIILIFSTSLVALFFIIFANSISFMTSIPKQWLWSVILAALGQVFIAVVMTIWLAQAKALKYGFYKFLQAILNMALTILLVVNFHQGWQGSVAAQIITLAVFGAIGIIILFRGGKLRFAFDPEYIRNILKFCVPLIPHELGSLLMISTDKIFITRMQGIADTGIYSVGYQFALAIEVVGISFAKAYVPWFFERLKRNDEKVNLEIVRYNYIYFAALIIFAVIFSLFASWFMQFFVGKAFVGARIYVLWIALGYAFSGMYYLMSNFLAFAEKTYLLARATIAAALINIALTYLLIKANGALGAAQATAVAFAVHFALTWYYASKVHKMPWLKGLISTT